MAGPMPGMVLRQCARALSASSTIYQHLPALALIVHDVKPHAADPEKMARLMGYFHSPRCNQLLSKSLTGVKIHHTSTDKNR